MTMKNIIPGALMAVVMLLANTAHASTISYVLDNSNALDDGIDYLTVLIDETASGLDFRIETEDALNSIAGTNFGIQSFAFSLTDGIGLTPDDFTLPDGWKLTFNRTMSEAGSFDYRLTGTGGNRADPLLLSVAGIGLDDLMLDFAAHVAGFSSMEGYCTDPTDSFGPQSRGGGCSNISSAFFYGARPITPTNIPLPAALLLFVSGLLGLAGIAHTRTATLRQH